MWSIAMLHLVAYVNTRSIDFTVLLLATKSCNSIFLGLGSTGIVSDFHTNLLVSGRLGGLDQNLAANGGLTDDWPINSCKTFATSRFPISLATEAGIWALEYISPWFLCVSLFLTAPVRSASVHSPTLLSSHTQVPWLEYLRTKKTVLG